MGILIYISSLIMPLVVVFVILYSLFQGKDVYADFIDGTKEGLTTVINILPTLIGLMCGVAVISESGALEALSNFLLPISEILGFPKEIIPLSLMKGVSSSGATSLMTDIFNTSGADSFVGRVASVMMSSTETIVYTMSVYFTCVGIEKTRHTLRGAILANIAGVIGAYWVVVKMFGM